MRKAGKTAGKRTPSKRSNAEVPELILGFQWGEPPVGETSLIVERLGDELEVIGVMPQYASDHSRFDLLLQYKESRSNSPIKRVPPHIRFANAQSDDDLIQFVRTFGPVICTECKILQGNAERKQISSIEEPFQTLQVARQDLKELRNEQNIFKAALGLVIGLVRNEREYDFAIAQERIGTIAAGIREWPKQWRRERRFTNSPLLWRMRPETVQRIVALSKTKRNPPLGPEVDARIVLSELINAFPAFVFPNPVEMHSYLRFGIRPLLYAILRNELLQPRDVAICANDQCRTFFEIERAGQRFCTAYCSRRYRQREYWKVQGKEARRRRLVGHAKSATT